MSVKPNLAKRTTKRSSAGLQRLSCTPWRLGSISSPGSVESGRSASALHSPESFGRPAAGSRAGFRCGIKLAGIGIRSRLQRELRLYRLRDETADGSPPQFLIMGGRSEEHTSELQSRLHLVCRLLLEKKKKNKMTNTVGNDVCTSSMTREATTA